MPTCYKFPTALLADTSVSTVISDSGDADVGWLVAAMVAFSPGLAD